MEDIVSQGSQTKASKTVLHHLTHILLLIDRSIGLRHLFLISILIFYSVLGGYVIYYFESSAEAVAIPAKKAQLDSRIMEIVLRYKNGNSNLTLSEKTAALKKDYIAMLNTDGLLKWSTFYKTDEPNHWKWTFGSSLFYASNVFTTTGYGSIAPDTFAAKCFTMFYGTIFVPLTWIIIRDIGQLALVYLTTAYARLKLRFTNAGEKSDEVFMLPISICLGICILIMLCGTVYVHSYDALSGPPDSGLSWFLSFYFTFQSFTTIGLGDVMPNNIPFDVFICSVFFFSLPMLKVINRMCYLSMENGVHGSFSIISNKMEAFVRKEKTSPETGSRESKTTDEEKPADEVDMTNQLTIHSIATFMQSNADVYGGSFGRVNLRKSDIEPECP
ncbi:unnamed protein product [Haemonchus placei]|uniref:Ion channel n=1 Tax=Haemonchus placei TaxID=6290 RepID=A0A0N4W2Y3_HAEPC|nr:unnamed protein product [Haemonchus placei]